MSIDTFDREEFIRHRWRYRPGEHVTILGPTGCGKTHLTHQLLEYTAHPKMPAIVLAMKPRDSTTSGFSKRLGYRTVRTWPPVWNPFKASPPGYTLWPKHTFDPDTDDANMYRHFRAAILDAYKRGDRIVYADELLGLSSELNLSNELRALWTRGRSMGTALWGSTQKPTHIPLWAYNQAEHLFIAYDPDRRSQDRFDEIGGVSPGLIRDTVNRLRKYQFVYIRRDGPALCIIDK